MTHVYIKIVLFKYLDIRQDQICYAILVELINTIFLFYTCTHEKISKKDLNVVFFRIILFLTYWAFFSIKTFMQLKTCYALFTRITYKNNARIFDFWNNKKLDSVLKFVLLDLQFFLMHTLPRFNLLDFFIWYFNSCVIKLHCLTIRQRFSCSLLFGA